MAHIQQLAADQPAPHRRARSAEARERGRSPPPRSLTESPSPYRSPIRTPTRAESARRAAEGRERLARMQAGLNPMTGGAPSAPPVNLNAANADLCVVCFEPPSADFSHWSCDHLVYCSDTCSRRGRAWHDHRSPSEPYLCPVCRAWSPEEAPRQCLICHIRYRLEDGSSLHVCGHMGLCWHCRTEALNIHSIPPCPQCGAESLTDRVRVRRGS